jgi:protein TonB
MPPTVKDLETATANPTVPNGSSGSAARIPGEPTGKPQPVALEIPVTVNGARSVEGSDKREPFSETTKTVLIFGHGAVIRLSAMVAPGQLLFLTNEKSKKEVVCQVVKSKNYKTVTGYVELEFTEASTGFWGMRFPATASAPRPVAPAAGTPPPAPVAPKVQAPVAPVSIAPGNVPPVPVQPVVTAKPELAALPAAEIAPPPVSTVPVAPAVAKPATPAEESPAAAQKIAPRTETPGVSAINLEPASFSTVAAAESKVEKPKDTVEAAPASPSSEELKQQAARLQEQLGAMLFADSSGSKTSAPPAAAPEALSRPDAERKLLDLFEEKVEPPVNVAASAAEPLATSLDAEEVKIPSWLAPLARDTESAAATAAQEPQSYASGESSASGEESSGAIVPFADEVTEKAQTAMFGGQLVGDASLSGSEASASGSKKGLLFGIAAALLLLGSGGYWYMQQQGRGSNAASAAATPRMTQPAEAAKTPVHSSAPTTESPAVSGKGNSPVILPPAGGSSSGTPGPIARGSSPFTPAPTVAKDSAPATSETAAPVAKKPVLGQVRLANPVVGRAKGGADTVELAPSIDANQPAAGGDALGGLAATHEKQPAAPIPVGGEVKQAQLLKSVPPAYPSMAKSQRVSGDVKIDALIDAAGNVTSTKVLSGPTLLHQAAMDAVKQWRYRPAELDGKPTSMHLNIVVQFRLQ